MPAIQIIKWQTGFAAKYPHQYAFQRVEWYFNKHLIQQVMTKSKGKITFVPGDPYFIHVARQLTTYYAIGVLDSYTRFLINNNLEYEIVDTPIPPAAGLDIDFSGHKLNLVEPADSDFAWQNDASVHVADPNNTHTIFQIQTGRGKSIGMMKSVIRYGKRALLITKPSYLDKWCGDYRESLNITKDEYLLLDSVAAIDKAIGQAKAGKLPNHAGRGPVVKAMLMSSYAFDNWLRHWIDGESIHPDVEPMDLLNVLGVGFMAVDESHQIFRKNYWSYIMLNPGKLLDMSATLSPDNEFIRRRYCERFPVAYRYDKLEYKVYIDAYAVSYSCGRRDIVKSTNWMRPYNHTQFEKHIYKNRDVKERYFDFVYGLLKNYYLYSRESGQRALVFFSTVYMCDEFIKYLRVRERQLDIKRYTQGDSYDRAVQADVIVSTPGKSSTAIDVKGLVLSLVTPSVKDSQNNIQTLGRTRVVTKWDITPKLVYIYCKEINKHVFFHHHREKAFRGKVKNHHVVHSGAVI